MLTPEPHKELIQKRIDDSPFSGYLKAEINALSFIYLDLCKGESSFSYENREKAYSSVLWEIVDLCNQSWKDLKEYK